MKIAALPMDCFCELALSKEPCLCISSRDATRTQVPPGKGQKRREAKGGKGKEGKEDCARNCFLSLA